jgi:hypothetical protein
MAPAPALDNVLGVIVGRQVFLVMARYYTVVLDDKSELRVTAPAHRTHHPIWMITRGVSGSAGGAVLLSGHGASLGDQVSGGEPAGCLSQAAGQVPVAWAARGARPLSAATDARERPRLFEVIAV